MPPTNLHIIVRTPYRSRPIREVPRRPQANTHANHMALPDRESFLRTQPEPVDPSIPFTGDCIICSDSLTYPVTLPCGGKHIFCQGCIGRWFQESNTCPLCREVLFREKSKRILLNQTGHVHYSTSSPPPPYDHAVRAQQYLEADLTGRLVLFEELLRRRGEEEHRRFGEQWQRRRMERERSSNWQGGLMGWAARTWGDVSDGASCLFGFWHVQTNFPPLDADRREGMVELLRQTQPPNNDQFRPVSM